MALQGANDPGANDPGAGRKRPRAKIVKNLIRMWRHCFASVFLGEKRKEKKDTGANDPGARRKRPRAKSMKNLIRMW